jgi:hypothetical protein
MVDAILDSCGFILLVFGFVFLFQSDFGASTKGITTALS